MRSAPLASLTRQSTLATSVGDSIKDIIVVNSDTQIGINPCGMNNGGCDELCLFNGTHANCRCYHAQIDTDGKSCKGKEGCADHQTLDHSLEAKCFLQDRMPL